MDRFLSFKVAEGSSGENWVRRMRWELSRVPELLGRTPVATIPRHAREVTREHILAVRRGMPWEKATFAIHFAAVRQWLRWAGNPVAGDRGVWRLPAGQPSRRRWLSRSQLEVLFGATDGRTRALIALEGLNGLRRIEVLRLRRKDVLVDEACLRVLGKGRDGGKWRKIPMHPLVAESLDPLLRDLGEEERLFPLSSSGADLLLRTAAARAGFPAAGVRVSHHDLRRTFGRLAHESGMDLIQLKHLLGHSSVEMTVHYIGLDADRMRAGLNRLRLRRRATA